MTTAFDPLRLPARIILSFGLLYCMYLVTTRAIAEWYYRQPPPQGFRKAIEWDPQNPIYYFDLGRFLQTSLQGGDLAEVIHLYEKAVELSPYRTQYWAQLAGAYEVAGQMDDAQKAYERARRLFPHSPEINWVLANYYIRQDRLPDAIVLFQKALLGDMNLRRQVYDLLWRAEAPQEIILIEILPTDVKILFEYLNFMVEKNQVEIAVQAWNRILELDRSFEVPAAFPYLDALIREKRLELLKAAWSALNKSNPTVIRQAHHDPNLLVNGDLEGEILNGGLDWRVQPLESVIVSVDTLTYFDGTRSLRIEFQGKHNVDYRHIWQYVLVTPNTRYRFTGYLRTQGITTDSGLRFQIYDAYDPSHLYLSSEPMIGTSGWAPVHLEFATGPETGLLVVRIGRPSSQKLDNLIKGVAWIDRTSLIAVP